MIVHIIVLLNDFFFHAADLSLAMFKSGDDLRQDSFVLQMVEVMNRIWLLSGQDYRIITFNVVTTGDRQGKPGCLN